MSFAPLCSTDVKPISLESVENAAGYESVIKSDESVLEIFFNKQ